MEYTVYSLLWSIQCTVYYGVYSVQFIMEYTVYSLLWSIQCTVYHGVIKMYMNININILRGIFKRIFK